MELETINKLYLELSQIATAKTAREVEMMRLIHEANDVLRSASEIAMRDGQANWPAFRAVLFRVLEDQHRFMYPKPCEERRGE